MKSNQFNSHLPAFVAAIFFLIVIMTIFTMELSGYSIAETLMNYQFGFYRRALFGNFIVWLENPFYISILIRIIYCLCLGGLFLIVLRETRSWEPVSSVTSLSILLISPFGVLFYLKNSDALRKELLFTAAFGCFLFFVTRSNLIKTLAAFIATIVCGLIHESFFFLFLPFFLSYLYLNDILPAKHLTILVVFSLFLLACITFLVPGNSAQITQKFVNQFVDLGFNTREFYTFSYYQKMSFSENISTSMAHFKDVHILIYNLLYILQFVLLYFLSKIYKIRFHVPKKQHLALSLVFIWLGVLLLSIIAMDYGRWLAMAFCCSLILTTSQVKLVSSELRRPLKSYDYLLLATLITLELCIYIPHWTSGSVKLQVWTWINLGGHIPTYHDMTRKMFEFLLFAHI
jgi:hypothetical protein